MMGKVDFGAPALGEGWMACPVPALVGDGIALMVQFAENASGRQVISGLMLWGPVTADALRKIPIAALECEVNKAQREPWARALALPRLSRQAGDDPAKFIVRVAEHYRVWLACTPHPAPVMAERSGVSVHTVHGWLREARLRGFLPEGRPGKQVR